MPTIMHFDVPADDTGRAKKFYEELLTGSSKDIQVQASTIL